MSKTRLRTTVKKQRGGAPLVVNKCETAYPELYKYVKFNFDYIKDCIKLIPNKGFADTSKFLKLVNTLQLNNSKITVPNTNVSLNIKLDTILTSCDTCISLFPCSG